MKLSPHYYLQPIKRSTPPAQGPALPWAARRLKVTAPAEPLDVKVTPLEALHADLLQTHIPSGSRLHGMEIFEFQPPAQANVALIVHGNEGFAPSPTIDTPEPASALLIAATATRPSVIVQRLPALGYPRCFLGR